MEAMTENKVVPMLRFGEFDGGWIDYRLGDVCNKIQDGNYGGSYPKADEFVKEGIPFLTSKALGGDGFLKEDKFDFLPIKKHNQLKKAHIELNDVLFTNRGSNVGVISFVDERINGGNIGPQLTLLRSDLNIVTPLFLKVSLVTFNFKKQVKSQDSGSAMNFFGIKATSRFKLHLPALPEQKKIATFLSSVDAKIQELSKKKSLLADYKKGVMQKIFSQELRFKDSEGNDYPDWEEKKLGEISNITIGEFVIKTKQNPNSEHPVYNGGKTYTGFYDNYNNEGDKIVISARGANAGFVNYVERKFWAGNSCYSVEIMDKKDNCVLFIYNYIKFKQRLFTDFQQAANIPSVSKKETQIFKVVCPTFEEQQQIANFLSALDTKIEAVNTQINNTQAFKKGLLQQMFV